MRCDSTSRSVGRPTRSGRGGLGLWHSRRAQLGLRDLDQRHEGRRVVDRQVGEDLAVDLDPGLTQTLDEAVVGDSLSAGSGVDALDPELAELALLRPAVAVAV